MSMCNWRVVGVSDASLCVWGGGRGDKGVKNVVLSETCLRVGLN